MKLKKFTQMNWGLILLFFLCMLNSNVTTAYPGNIQEMKFLDAIKEISKNFDVYFSFDREMVEDLIVHYEAEKIRSLDEAVNSILKGTNLQYKLFDKRFVIIYKKDLEGIRSMKRMMSHMENIIASDERDLLGLTDKLPLQQAYDPPAKSLKRLIINISGTVSDDEGSPLIGVNVQIKGTNQGTSTDFDGKFTINDINENAILVFSYIGYQTVEIPLNGRSSLEVTLLSDSKLLDEVVVTALGIEREEKSLGYSIQKVGGDAVQTVKGVDIATSLTGKVAGLWIQNSTEFNEEPDIRLRGVKNPLVVIDGVPYGNMGFSNISPDDIESIEVLKGATAAALYGSRGGSGAIIITTKSGGNGISVNSNNMFFGGYLALPEVQTSYSAGLGGVYDPTDYVWGGKLDNGTIVQQWNPETKQIEEMELASRGKNNFQDFLEPGIVSNTNVSLARSGDIGSIRASMTHIYNKGQYPNLNLNSLNFTLGGKLNIGENLEIRGQMGYNRRIAPQTTGAGYGDQGYIYQILMWTGPEYNLSKYRDYWLVPDESQNWHYRAWYDNPYLIAYEKLRGIDNSMLNGNLTASYKVLSNLKLTFRYGYDFYNNEINKRNPPGINSTRGWHALGLYSQDLSKGYSMNGDVLLEYKQDLSKWMDMKIITGSSIYKYEDEYSYAATRGGLVIPGFYSLRNSIERPDASSSIGRKQVNSIFATGTFSFFDAFYLDIAGRNDWSSSLPESTRSFFYPSVGTSVVPSEFLNLPDWLDFWKLRGSWTISKQDLAVFATNQSYAINSGVWDGLNTSSYPSTIRGGDVDPETTRTWEIGTAAYLFDKSLVADFTYYNVYNYNIQRSATISSASGFNSTLVNIDETYERRGFEISLDASVINKDRFKWNVITNWAKTHLYYKSLDPVYSADNLWTRAGERVDTYTGRNWSYDPNGNLIHQANGLPLREDYTTLWGYSDPDFIWGLTNSFEWGPFNFHLSFDGRVGGLLENYSSQKMWDTGSHPDSDNEWRYDEVVNGNISFVGEGVQIASGDVVYDNYGQIIEDSRTYAPNDTKVSYETYARRYGDGRFGASNPTFLKLREVSIGYTLPRELAERWGLGTTNISLTSQNVLLWAKEFRMADPDWNSDTQLTSPSVRYIGVNMRIHFATNQTNQK